MLNKGDRKPQGKFWKEYIYSEIINYNKIYRAAVFSWTCIVMAIKVAVILFTYLSIVTDIVRGQVTDEDVNRIFKSLENYGNANKKKDMAKQFVVLFVASIGEIRLSEDFIPQRAKIFENDDSGEKLHGELLLLDRHEITQLAQDISQRGNTPFIFIYSTYIPCASIKGKKFSCAEELGAYTAAYGLSNRFFVGYNTTYNGTVKEDAKQFLSNGGILVYEKQEDVYVKSNLPPAEKFVAHLFQPSFLGCLEEWITCNSWISTVVNVLVRHCLNINTGGRRVTLRSRYLLFGCLRNKSESTVKFAGQQTELATSFCILKSLDKSNAIGKPTENSLYCNSWVLDQSNPSTMLYEGSSSENDPYVNCDIKKKIKKKEFYEMADYAKFPKFVRSSTDYIFYMKKQENEKCQERKRQRPGSSSETSKRTRHNEQSSTGSRVRDQRPT